MAAARDIVRKFAFRKVPHVSSFIATCNSSADNSTPIDDEHATASWVIVVGVDVIDALRDNP